MDEQRDLGPVAQSELPDKLTVGEAISLYSSFYRQPADGAALLETLGLSGQRNRRFRKLPAARSSGCRSRSR